MHRVFKLFSVLVLSVAIWVHAMSTAQAYPSGPEITGGEAPWVSLSGISSSYASDTVYTVPDDRVFVVTGAIMNSYDIHLYADSTLKVNGYSRAMYFDSRGFLSQGNGRVVFEPGTNVVLISDGPGRYYTIQGYLAHP